MISPFSGAHATLMYEPRELEYRKEKYPFVAQFYVDDETHDQFTTTEMDEANLAQVYNQYRVRHSIPFVDEIVTLRKSYGLSAAKMSLILGFGDNQYRQYEEGYMPSETNGKILKACSKPEVFKTFVMNSRAQLSEKDYEKIMSRLEELKEYTQKQDMRKPLVYGQEGRCAANGYAPQSLERLRALLLFYISSFHGVYNTKMNKLLFYTDFYHYRQYGQAISGLRYHAIQFGPVPARWDKVYALVDDVEQELIAFDSSRMGTKLVSSQKPDLTCLTSQEVETLQKVAQRFKNSSSKEISATSHDEEAWIHFVGKKEYIDFNMAFKLRAL
jgi:uncharacterized phage-associated protein/transcriptional regulator with XRE-family HTH domain